MEGLQDNKAKETKRNSSRFFMLKPCEKRRESQGDLLFTMHCRGSFTAKNKKADPSLL